MVSLKDRKPDRELANRLVTAKSRKLQSQTSSDIRNSRLRALRMGTDRDLDQLQNESHTERRPANDRANAGV